MRNILIVLILFTSFFSCNESDKYLQQLNQQNNLLNKEIDRNYKIISKFSQRNETKYKVWKCRCDEIIKLRDTILDNRNNIHVLKYAVNYLDDFTKWFNNEKNDNYIDFLNLDFDINDKIENEIFINKFLTVSNSYIDRIVFNSNVRNFRFTCLNSIVRFDNWSGVYNEGEEVTAIVFIAAMDTTVKPEIVIKNEGMLDTFDSFGRGIYKTIASKKGINTIEGGIIIKHDYMNWNDTFPFLTEYLVK